MHDLDGCSLLLVQGFVPPFSNNHVKQSRGKCKGVFLRVKGEMELNMLGTTNGAQCFLKTLTFWK